MQKSARTAGLMDSQRWHKVARWLGIQQGQLPKANQALADAKGAWYPIRGYSGSKSRWPGRQSAWTNGILNTAFARWIGTLNLRF